MEALRYERGRLELIDQRKLPQEETWIPVNSAADAWDCINKMVVRGSWDEANRHCRKAPDLHLALPFYSPRCTCYRNHRGTCASS